MTHSSNREEKNKRVWQAGKMSTWKIMLHLLRPEQVLVIEKSNS